MQEALTNVIRHTHARAVTVSVIRDQGAVVVKVVDDGAGAATTGTGGYDLAGMLERAAALGGSVTHGPVPGGGFRVRAVLPVRRDPLAEGPPS